MNLTLLKKELNGLRFCILLIMAIMGMIIIGGLLSGFPDRSPFDVPDADDIGELVEWLLVGLFIGMISFNQEREHHTQGFLDGLAVSRFTIFLHKLLAALLVGVFFCVLKLLFLLLCAGLSTTSVSGPIKWQLMLAEQGLQLLLGVNVVAVGMVLSFTRKWFPLVVGLLVFVLILMFTSSFRWVSWIDFSALILPTLDTRGAVFIPWRQVTGCSLVAFGTLLLAVVLFQWGDEIVSRWHKRHLTNWQKLPFAAVIAVIIAVTTAMVCHVFVKSTHADHKKSSAAAALAKTQTTQPDAESVGSCSHSTGHYDVIFKESQREEVMKLVDEMDSTYQQVADYFQNPSLPPGRIVLDVASSVDSHAAGVTNWTKIRVPMLKGERQLDFMQTLRHETAHVFIGQISDGKATEYFNAMRVFHEGVATAVELSTDDEATRAARLKMERWVALVDSRERVPLDLLCDDNELKTKFEAAVVYPLGYVFAKSLVKVGGPALPRRVLETLKKSPPSTRSDSTRFWEQILQECGTSLETIIATYTEELALIKTQEESYVAGFPRLSAKVTVENEEIVIRLDDFSDQAEGLKPICLVLKPMGLNEINQPLEQSDDGSFRLNLSEHTGNELHYLLGWLSDEMRYPVFEPWAKVSLK
jgi:ABC-type transport system involved in multi-copper enzyme maturation permease subunit